MRGLAAKGGEYGVAGAIQAFEDTIVGDAEDAEAEGLQIGRAAGIMVDSAVVAVSRAVHFNHEAGFRAEEIDDVGALEDLPAEFPSAESAVAKGMPEAAFGVGMLRSEAAGSVREI